MKLRGQIKRKMALIREDLDKKKTNRTGLRSGGPKFFIEKEGSAQIAFVGMTNVGKSSLLAAVTNAKVEVSPVPFTSRDPVPSIMNYLDIQIPDCGDASVNCRVSRRQNVGSTNACFGAKR